MADRIGVMQKGVLDQVGTPEDIYLRPRTRFVATFLGGMNWIDGVGVRPEAIRVTPQAPPGQARAATVVRSSFLGNCLHIEAALKTGETVLVETSRFEPGFAPGDSVYVWWRPCDELQFEEGQAKACPT